MKLSVVIATFNEENNIAACLDSVNTWADEIVVVDGGSTDKTVEIARAYNAHVLITDNPPIFHINKQKAIDKAKGIWVLQLDADEQLTPALRSEIDEKIKSTSLNGFWMPRKNYFLGRFLMKGGVYPDYTLRLYKNGKGRLPQKDVHEQAVVDGETGYLVNPLVHIADPTFSRYFLRWNRYTNLLAQEIANERICLVCKFVKYLLVKPMYSFLLQYIRHKGFMDNWQGFVFAFFSSLRFPVGFIKSMKL